MKQQTPEDYAIWKSTIIIMRIESCNAIGAIMALMWLLTFTMWKVGILEKQQGDFIIWSFQMGFSGELYMALMPVARFSLNMRLKHYHWVSLTVGLLSSWYAGKQLSIAGMLDFRSFTLQVAFIVPPLIVLPSVWLHTTKHEQSNVA